MGWRRWSPARRGTRPPACARPAGAAAAPRRWVSMLAVSGAGAAWNRVGWDNDLCGRAGHDRLRGPVVPALQAGEEVPRRPPGPYDNVDIDEHPEAIDRLKELQDGGQIIPTVVYADGTHEVNPSDEALARRIGLTLEADRSAYDLVIVGGGPAGLAAAIYAAREGIDAIVVDASALGRPGRDQRPDRQLPGLPRRHLRRRAGRAVRRPGPPLRGRAALGRVGHRRRARRRRPGHARCRPASSSPRTPSSWPPARPTGASTFPARTTSSAPASTSAPPATGRSTRGPTRSSSSAAATRPWRRDCTCPSSPSGSGCWPAPGLSASPVLQERVRSDPQFVDPHRRGHRRARGRAGPVRRRRGPRSRRTARSAGSRPPRPSCSSG